MKVEKEMGYYTAILLTLCLVTVVSAITLGVKVFGNKYSQELSVNNTFKSYEAGKFDIYAQTLSRRPNMLRNIKPVIYDEEGNEIDMKRIYFRTTTSSVSNKFTVSLNTVRLEDKIYTFNLVEQESVSGIEKALSRFIEHNDAKLIDVTFILKKHVSAYIKVLFILCCLISIFSLVGAILINVL